MLKRLAEWIATHVGMDDPNPENGSPERLPEPAKNVGIPAQEEAE